MAAPTKEQWETRRNIIATSPSVLVPDPHAEVDPGFNTPYFQFTFTHYHHDTQIKKFNDALIDALTDMSFLEFYGNDANKAERQRRKEIVDKVISYIDKLVDPGESKSLGHVDDDETICSVSPGGHQMILFPLITDDDDEEKQVNEQVNKGKKRPREEEEKK